MATGVLFSKVQWGAWWSWDPRQTSFLLVLLLLAAYEVLRLSIADEEVRARSSAAYIAAAALPALFLIFVLPRMPRFAGLHPSTTLVRGELDATYGTVLWTMVAVFFGLTLWMFRLRVRAVLLEHELVTEHESMDDRGHPAATGVVRPVSVPPER
jgi:heme exporter protein C